MPATIQELVDEISPANTVLILGAGASIPSGAPSTRQLLDRIADDFSIPAGNLTLREISGLAEHKRNRASLVATLRRELVGLRPKEALLNVPLYNWKSIFSTNFDELLEAAYERAKRPYRSYSSRFDFTADAPPDATKIFKIHGTISKDIADGNVSRLIITDADYDSTDEYRESIYDRLKSDLNPGTLVVIIGQSLADEDLRAVVQRAVTINQKTEAGGRISLLLYDKDENRARLFESRGIRVAFGGLDEFFDAMARKAPDHVSAHTDTGSPLDFVTGLRPTTRNIADEVDPACAEIHAMYSGRAADYADIARGFTFERQVAVEIVQFLQGAEALCATLVGASGVGKTTAARQALLRFRGLGAIAYEHKGDHALSVEGWCQVATRLKSGNKIGVLLIDDGHSHLRQLNDLVDRLAADKTFSLKLVITAPRNHWAPRVKTPNFFVKGRGHEFPLSQLNYVEIDRLLSLVETLPEMRALVEEGFGGFSRYEKRRRLIERCEAEMFVCMKNIFASEKFDDIILREYSGLPDNSRDIYRHIAAMEHAGIRVHRQLVMRLLGLGPNSVAGILQDLEEIVSEYTINEKEGVYGWRTRHPVIAGIVAKYKFYEKEKLLSLFEHVIDSISPTYEIEIRTIREMCNIESGLMSISDKRQQNTLLRRMMSVAPGERVPRHRLMRNLIELGEFEKAESEIRIFEKDFGRDAPTARYRILLMVARATASDGLMPEDRRVVLMEARSAAVAALERFDGNKHILGAYCEVGIEMFRLTGSHQIFDEAMSALKRAETRLGDPDVTKMILRFQRRVLGQPLQMDDIDSTPAK